MAVNWGKKSVIDGELCLFVVNLPETVMVVVSEARYGNFRSVGIHFTPVVSHTALFGKIPLQFLMQFLSRSQKQIQQVGDV